MTHLYQLRTDVNHVIDYAQHETNYEMVLDGVSLGQASTFHAAQVYLDLLVAAGFTAQDVIGSGLSVDAFIRQFLSA
jgi:hypothetical protein